MSSEMFATMMMALIMSSMEGVKLAMNNSQSYKVLQVFFLIGFGLLWGGFFECWQAAALTWEAFHRGGELGLGVAVNAGLAYGIIRGIQKKRDGNGHDKTPPPI